MIPAVPARLGAVALQPCAKAEGPSSIAVPALRRVTAEEILKLGGGEPEAPKRVRVRFAPSPTGPLHIGGARTALVNYLFAKAKGGDFLLRIEDTDPMSSQPESTEAILDGLKWLGLTWDEEVIHQSQRTELYQRKVEELLAKGRARRDPETGAVYFIMPKEGKLVVDDRLKGRIELAPEADFVIQRSDGSPMFLLANVVDDGEQQITHIFRGHEHLTHAAKQIELFRALDYPVPELYHLPLILGDPIPDPEDPTAVKHRGKLSKRHGATSVLDYRAQGFSAKAVIDHLARLGTGLDPRGSLSLDELAPMFDPTRLSKKETVLGLTECVKRGGKYRVRPGPLQMRMFAEIARMPTEALALELERFLADRGLVLSAEQLFALADGGKMRFTTYLDALDFASMVLAPPRFEEKQVADYCTAEIETSVNELLLQLERIDPKDWTLPRLDAELTKLGCRRYGKALRWMLTANAEGFPLHHTMVLLGKDETIFRQRYHLGA